MSVKQPQRRKAGRSTSGRRPASDASTKRLGYLLAMAVLSAILYLVSAAHDQSSAYDRAEYVAGSLENVITNPSLPEQIVYYKGMTVSFNSSTHQPNWVAWELLASETDGENERELGFQTDDDVEGCANSDDYKRSGYDRGHMAPAGDMKWDADAMRQSFLMTNICPQAGDLNRGAWKKLEEKCRQRAVMDSALVVVCGPVFEQSEANERIGKTGVAVPRKFFKVVLSPYSTPPTAIGFIMPNGYVKGGMQACAVSVDSVEALTGHDFFASLPDDIEAKVESQCDFNRWSNIRRRR